MLIAATSADRITGDSGLCVCVADARDGRFTIPPIALGNLPATAGDGIRFKTFCPRLQALGFEPADIIVGIDDERVKNYDDLYNVLDKYHPGDKVKVRVLRGKEVVAIEVALVVVQ